MKALMTSIAAQIAGYNENQPQERGILATPPNPLERSSSQGCGKHGIQKKGEKNSFTPGMAKLEFPKFDGEQVRDWIQTSETFFHLYAIMESQRMMIVEMHLEEKVNVWFQSIKIDRGMMGWSEFKEMVNRRFGVLGDEDAVEEFNKLQQTSTAMAYQERFEELRALVLLNNPGLSETYFVSELSDWTTR